MDSLDVIDELELVGTQRVAQHRKRPPLPLSPSGSDSESDPQEEEDYQYNELYTSPGNSSTPTESLVPVTSSEESSQSAGGADTGGTTPKRPAMKETCPFKHKKLILSRKSKKKSEKNVTAEGEAILSELKKSQQEYQCFSRKSTKIRKENATSGKDSKNFQPF